MNEDILKELVADLRDYGANRFMLRAADEIERLRRKNADDGRETLTELRQRVETLTAERDSTIRKLRKVRAERDEARRQLCTELWLSRGGQCSVESIAEARGWDCFKEEP